MGKRMVQTICRMLPKFGATFGFVVDIMPQEEGGDNLYEGHRDHVEGL